MNFDLCMAYLCSGYVLSNRLVSDLIAQITENPEMHDVLKEILTPLGVCVGVCVCVCVCV